MEIRPLKVIDYDRGFFECLNSLKTSSMSKNDFTVNLFIRISDGIDTLVMIEDEEVIATASFFIERKFLGGGSKCCHIEDVAVLEGRKGLGHGRKMIEECIKRAKDAGCYKAILMCSDENIPFYEKCGFKVNQNAMKQFCD